MNAVQLLCAGVAYITTKLQKITIIVSMIIGIISDTHDKYPSTIKGLDLLIAAGATYLIHCGDWTKSETLIAISKYAA